MTEVPLKKLQQRHIEEIIKYLCFPLVIRSSCGWLIGFSLVFPCFSYYGSKSRMSEANGWHCGRKRNVQFMGWDRASDWINLSSPSWYDEIELPMEQSFVQNKTIKTFLYNLLSLESKYLLLVSSTTNYSLWTMLRTSVHNAYRCVVLCCKG